MDTLKVLNIEENLLINSIRTSALKCFGHVKHRSDLERKRTVREGMVAERRG